MKLILLKIWFRIYTLKLGNGHKKLGQKVILKVVFLKVLQEMTTRLRIAKRRI